MKIHLYIRQILLIAIISLMIIAAFYFQKPGNRDLDIYKGLSAQLVSEDDREQIFGIYLDSLRAFKATVKPNQSISEILLGYQISYQTIDKLAKKAEGILDLRKIRSGNHYTILYDSDSVHTARYFIYEKSPIQYVVVDLRDSVVVYEGQKQVKRTIKTTAGRIETSLWNTIAENHTDANLALELADMYAWNIDFYGIRRNDSYKVVYEEISVEGKVIGIGKILSATFNHMGRDFNAFYFVQDSSGDYFDEQGNSLRRQFLKAPLTFKRISSRFSNSRLHPILKIRRPHLGVDYAAPKGTPVHSIGDGTVVKVTRTRGAGNMLKIRHNSTYSTGYLHLWKFADGIREGVKVKQGDVIGYVGSTGLSTGPHLDFRFYKNGEPIDPLTVESPPVMPVDAVHKDRFLKHVELEMKRLLDISVYNELTSL